MKKNILPKASLIVGILGLVLICSSMTYATLSSKLSNVVASYEFDSTSGTTAVDSLGYSDGVATGSYVWNNAGLAANLGRSINITAGASFFTVNNNSRYNSIVGNVSVNVWLKSHPVPSLLENDFLYIYNDVAYKALIISLYNDGSNTHLRFCTGDGSTVGCVNLCSGSASQFDNILRMYTVTYDRNIVIGYFNGTQCGNASMTRAISISGINPILGRIDGQNYQGLEDSLTIWNAVLNASEIAQLYNAGSGLPFSSFSLNEAPVIYGLVCSGDISNPYTTPDTLPSFNFSTTVIANCRISNKNLSYSAMGSTRNCTGGEGTISSHVCTLTSQDILTNYTSYVYISCINANMSNESMASLQMEITANNISNIVVSTGDNTMPYNTSSTTPTFNFSTAVNDYCRISDKNLGYAGMGANRSCAIGEGNITHGCTLTVQDTLTNYTSFIYLSCVNTNMSNEVNTQLQMEINNTGLSNINCTSSGDNLAPYTTFDTTPTFNFSTGVNSYCRISDKNLNYSAMGSTRNCTTGDGNFSEHRCTLTIQDELTNYTDYVYIACITTAMIGESTTALPMEITSLDTNATGAILRGVVSSSIVGATTYTYQKVYLRDLNGAVATGTVDVVAVYGNQRWLVHYRNETEPSMNLFNITPVVYVLELPATPISQISGIVSGYINSTKI